MNEDQNECFVTNRPLKQQQQFGKLDFDDDNDYDDEENNENVDDNNCSRLIKNFEELNLNRHLNARNDNVKNQLKLSNDDEDYDNEIENKEEDNSCSSVNISSSISPENSLSPSPPPVPVRRYQNHFQTLSSMPSAEMIKNGEQFGPQFSDNTDKNNSIGRSLRTSYSTGSVRSLLARKLNRTIGNNGFKSSLTNGQ